MALALYLMGMLWDIFAFITKTINFSSIYRLISVTHEQDSMPIKYNAFLINKQHPSALVK